MTDIKFDEKIPHKNFTQVRGYVFDEMAKTEGGKDRIKTLADESETREEETTNNPRKLKQAKARMDNPPKDPTKAKAKNATLTFVTRQVLQL